MEKIITSLLFVFILSVNTLSAGRWYVDPIGGLDTNTGASWAQAVQTIAKAATLGASFTVMVKTGTISSNSGTYTFPSSRKFYGSCAGNEAKPANRPMSDLDGNGIIEPWEFTNATVLSSTFAGNGFAFPNSNITVNGFTFTHVPSAALTPGQKTLYQAYASTLTNCIVTGCSLSLNLTASAFEVLVSIKGTVSNCLIEKNSVTVTATNDGTVNPLVTVAGSTFSNSVIRNNTVALNYSTTTCNNARGIILQASSSTSAPTTIYNTLVYNNEITYMPSGPAPATMSTASTVMCYASTATGTDSLYNCTIANNKGTNISSAGLKVYYTAAATVAALNNVLWNNQNNSTASDIAVSGTITAGSTIYNNYSKGTTLSDNGILVLNNALTTTPDFVNPSSGYGNSTSLADASIAKAIWTMKSTSDLIGKGVAIPGTGRTTDKAGLAFANPRAVGAYDYHTYTTTVTFNAAGTVNAYTSGDVITNPMGTQVPFTITPNAGYIITSVLYNGADVTSQLNSNVYTAPALTANATLVVRFDLGTGLAACATDNYRCFVSGHTIQLTGVNVNDEVTLYSLTGTKVLARRALSGSMTLEIPQGIYLVRSGSHSNKIVVTQ